MLKIEYSQNKTEFLELIHSLTEIRNSIEELEYKFEEISQSGTKKIFLNGKGAKREKIEEK